MRAGQASAQGRAEEDAEAEGPPASKSLGLAVSDLTGRPEEGAQAQERRAGRRGRRARPRARASARRHHPARRQRRDHEREAVRSRRSPSSTRQAGRACWCAAASSAQLRDRAPARRRRSAESASPTGGAASRSTGARGCHLLRRACAPHSNVAAAASASDLRVIDIDADPALEARHIDQRAGTVSADGVRAVPLPPRRDQPSALARRACSDCDEVLQQAVAMTFGRKARRSIRPCLFALQCSSQPSQLP